ncbi:hypothetical protein B0H13DRAFT_2428058 [Mycena leptocephala]|nr:hypothetical protein B0H13DRAFT_2428058 [Mycena leptocephala]
MALLAVTLILHLLNFSLATPVVARPVTTSFETRPSFDPSCDLLVNDHLGKRTPSAGFTAIPTSATSTLAVRDNNVPIAKPGPSRPGSSSKSSLPSNTQPTSTTRESSTLSSRSKETSHGPETSTPKMKGSASKTAGSSKSNPNAKTRSSQKTTSRSTTVISSEPKSTTTSRPASQPKSRSQSRTTDNTKHFSKSAALPASSPTRSTSPPKSRSQSSATHSTKHASKTAVLPASISTSKSTSPPESRSQSSATHNTKHLSKTAVLPASSSLSSDTVSDVVPVTTIPFNTNPIPPTSASSQTFIAPGITTVIPIPTASTVIELGSVSVIHETFKFTSTFSGSDGPVTSIQTIASAIPTGFGITVGPGGGVVGTIPTSLSQPGAISPVFSSFWIAHALLQTLTQSPHQGATEMTFTGKSGYVTVIPVPTAVVTIEIAAEWTHCREPPPGIVEIGGLSPVPRPGPGVTPDPVTSAITVSNSALSSAKSASTASSSGSPSSCGLIPVSTCGVYCEAPTDSAASSSPTGEASAKRKVSLVKRSRDMGSCKGGPKITSPVNGKTRYEAKSVPHTAFSFRTYAGSDFKLRTSYPQIKTVNLRTEHVFEFQIFAHFIDAFINDPRNSDLNGCTGPWLQTFYKSSEMMAVVSRIDNIKNIDLDENADLFRNTVQDIITALQKYDRRVGSQQSPPIAVQFYEYMQKDVSRYSKDAKTLAVDLIQRYGAKNLKKPIKFNGTCKIPFPEVKTAVAKNFPTMNAGALLPPRPLCFPTGSQATLDFRPRPYAPSTGVASSGMTVANAQSNGNNMRFDMKRTSGKIISPVPLTTPSECNGIYFNLDCTSRAIFIPALNPQACVLFDDGKPITPRHQLCGTTLANVLSCGAKTFPGASVMENEMIWNAVPE